MVTAVVESPQRQRQRQRLGSPLAVSGSSSTGGVAELKSRHWRPAKPAPRSLSSGGMRGRWAPPEIEIPGSGGRGYTSLRDIMSSPEYARSATSPDELLQLLPAGENAAASSASGGGGGGGDARTIRHPLVKLAANKYLQLTPSAREEEARRRARRRRDGAAPLCRLFFGCLGFLGALFPAVTRRAPGR